MMVRRSLSMNGSGQKQAAQIFQRYFRMNMKCSMKVWEKLPIQTQHRRRMRGTYSCTVKIPESNVSYTAAPVTVRLTIKKSTPKTPKAPLAAARIEQCYTGSAVCICRWDSDSGRLSSGYCAEQGEWRDSPVFDGLTPGTPYHFYVRIKADENTEASAASEAVTIRTKTAAGSVGGECQL